MRAIRGSPRPGPVTAAVPVGRRLIVSGCTMNSRVSGPGAFTEWEAGAEKGLGALGVRPRPAGADHARRHHLGGLRDDLAVSDQGGDVAEDLVGEGRVVGGS
jgi:hypothetical protein